MVKKESRIFPKIIKKGTALVVVLFLSILVLDRDNANRVYAQGNFNPTGGAGEGFEELQSINPDVFGWLNIFGTNIDYPLVQDGGGDNRRYEHTNARGEPAMAGAIFMDVRNDQDLSNFNNIIYGHDMRRAAMFGEISSFGDEAFFEAHQYGMIFNGETYYGIEIFAFLLVNAFDFEIYNPTMTDPDVKEAFIARIFTEALQYRDLDITVDDRLVMLSTCTPTATNGRHILVGRLTEEIQEDTLTGVRAGGIIGTIVDEVGQLGLAVGSLLVIFITAGIPLLVSMYRKKKPTAPTEEETQQPKKKKKAPTLLEEFLFLFGKIAVTLIALVLLFVFVFGATQINDAAMNPAMREGDITLFQRVGRDIEVSDVIVVSYDGQTQVRRVVAVEGDVVDITSQGLVVNGLLQQEFHIFEETTQFQDGVRFPITVSEGELFILGDSRTRAQDSRMYGPIEIDHVLGRVVTVIRRRNL